jgi:hypothetical protein
VYSQLLLSLGAPDCPVVRCTRPAPANWPLSGNLQRHTSIIHWTVWWANGRQRNGRSRNPRVTRGPSQRSAGGTGLSGVHRTVSGAPTSPKIQRSAAPGMEGDPHRTCYSDCPVVHRTVRCATRQKARIAFCWGLVLKCYELRTRQHKMLNINVLRPLKHYLPKNSMNFGRRL